MIKFELSISLILTVIEVSSLQVLSKLFNVEVVAERECFSFIFFLFYIGFCK